MKAGAEPETEEKQCVAEPEGFAGQQGKGEQRKRQAEREQKLCRHSRADKEEAPQIKAELQEEQKLKKAAGYGLIEKVLARAGK